MPFHAFKAWYVMNYKYFTYIIFPAYIDVRQSNHLVNNMNDFSSVIQNLQDAGCDQEFITKYVNIQNKGEATERLHLLACHRCRLMDAIHENQKKVDCLDYLIYCIKKDTGLTR